MRQHSRLPEEVEYPLHTIGNPEEDVKLHRRRRSRSLGRDAGSNRIAPSTPMIRPPPTAVQQTALTGITGATGSPARVPRRGRRPTRPSVGADARYRFDRAYAASTWF